MRYSAYMATCGLILLAPRLNDVVAIFAGVGCLTLGIVDAWRNE